MNVLFPQLQSHYSACLRTCQENFAVHPTNADDIKQKTAQTADRKNRPLPHKVESGRFVGGKICPLPGRISLKERYTAVSDFTEGSRPVS